MQGGDRGTKLAQFSLSHSLASLKRLLSLNTHPLCEWTGLVFRCASTWTVQEVLWKGSCTRLLMIKWLKEQRLTVYWPCYLERRRAKQLTLNQKDRLQEVGQLINEWMARISRIPAITMWVLVLMRIWMSSRNTLTFMYLLWAAFMMNSNTYDVCFCSDQHSSAKILILCTKFCLSAVSAG